MRYGFSDDPEAELSTAVKLEGITVLRNNSSRPFPSQAGSGPVADAVGLHL